ncbi:DUF4238 domain-containing protein [Agrobacterium tumefaciens]|nr:DUF4238 domain-containing protein [Agrobacterium tumefaciens]
MPQVTKRCHWVPQGYLKSFLNKDTGKIWRLGKDGGEPELKRLDKVAVKFHLYAPLGRDGQRDDSLEKKFADLEGFLGDALWKELCSGYPNLSWEPLRKVVVFSPPQLGFEPRHNSNSGDRCIWTFENSTSAFLSSQTKF